MRGLATAQRWRRKCDMMVIDPDLVTTRTKVYFLPGRHRNTDQNTFHPELGFHSSGRILSPFPLFSLVLSPSLFFFFLFFLLPLRLLPSVMDCSFWPCDLQLWPPLSLLSQINDWCGIIDGAPDYFFRAIPEDNVGPGYVRSRSSFPFESSSMSRDQGGPVPLLLVH